MKKNHGFILTLHAFSSPVSKVLGAVFFGQLEAWRLEGTQEDLNRTSRFAFASRAGLSSTAVTISRVRHRSCILPSRVVFGPDFAWENKTQSEVVCTGWRWWRGPKLSTEYGESFDLPQLRSLSSIFQPFLWSCQVEVVKSLWSCVGYEGTSPRFFSKSNGHVPGGGVADFLCGECQILNDLNEMGSNNWELDGRGMKPSWTMLNWWLAKLGNLKVTEGFSPCFHLHSHRTISVTGPTATTRMSCGHSWAVFRSTLVESPLRVSTGHTVANSETACIACTVRS